jgi:hypothetical protein
MMAGCGSTDMPALFSVRLVPGSSGDWQSRLGLVQRLGSLDGEVEGGADLQRFTPVEDEGYQPLDEREVSESNLNVVTGGQSTALVHLDRVDLNV